MSATSSKAELVASLLEAIATVLREKAASGKIVIASNLGIDGLAQELANNAATVPWLDIEIEREATETTLNNADEWRRDALAEAKAIDAVLVAHDIPEFVDGDDEPLELATRVGMLGNKVLASHEPPAPVARGPIALKRCVCVSPVFTCVTCNAVAPIGELKIALIALADATKELLVCAPDAKTQAALAAAEELIKC